MIQNYSMLSLFGVGFFTQLLDIFGIATYVNFMWWGWAAGTFGVAASGVAMSMLFWAYDRNYACSMDDADANQAGCVLMEPVIESRLIKWGLYDTTTWFNISMYVKSWVAVEWMNLSEEYREEKRQNMVEWRDMGKKNMGGKKDMDKKDMDDKDMDNEDMDSEDMESMMALIGF